MNDRHNRYLRLRYTAAGAVAALAAVGAIAGTTVLAATPRDKTAGHVATASGSALKQPSQASPPVPGKTASPQPGSSQPFLTAAQRLVDAGTITAAQGQTLDREIMTGGVDTQALASSGFTQNQLQAVQQALTNTKRALGAMR